MFYRFGIVLFGIGLTSFAYGIFYQEINTGVVSLVSNLLGIMQFVPSNLLYIFGAVLGGYIIAQLKKAYFR